MDAVFWSLLAVSLGALAWVYVGYPLLLAAHVAIRRGPPTPELPRLPGVSVILAVHNEEAVLRRKLLNCLALDYAADRLEIIVASDRSTDGTDAILREFEARGIRVLSTASRVGKTEAQNRAVALARQEILFFTDATTTHPPDVLRKIVRRFADPEVGCVSGRPVFRDDATSTSAGLQMKQRYDLAVRLMQARARTLFGASGCVYALRRLLYRPLRADLVSDLVEPLELLAAGYRTVLEPQALGLVDRPAPGPRLEFARRSRMALGGFRGIAHMRRLLDPRRNLFQAICLTTQRPLKWLSPLFAAGALVASIALSRVPAVRILLVAQIVFYGAALVVFLLETSRIRVPRLLAIPYYFCVLSLATVAGIVRLLRGETGQTWETVGR